MVYFSFIYLIDKGDFQVTVQNLPVPCLTVFEKAFIQIDRHGYIDSVVDAEQEYKYFRGSEMIQFPCYTPRNK